MSNPFRPFNCETSGGRHTATKPLWHHGVGTATSTSMSAKVRLAGSSERRSGRESYEIYRLDGPRQGSEHFVQGKTVNEKPQSGDWIHLLSRRQQQPPTTSGEDVIAGGQVVERRKVDVCSTRPVYRDPLATACQSLHRPSSHARPAVMAEGTHHPGRVDYQSRQLFTGAEYRL